MCERERVMQNTEKIERARRARMHIYTRRDGEGRRERTGKSRAEINTRRKRGRRHRQYM